MIPRASEPSRAKGPAAAEAASSGPRSGPLGRAGFACPAWIDHGVPKRPRPFGAWEGWYVVHYGDYVGYAAAAYIDTQGQ